MAKEGMVTKGVTFNSADREQQDMLKYVNSHSNVSAYIKRLIARDMFEKKIAVEKKSWA